MTDASVLAGSSVPASPPGGVAASGPASLRVLLVEDDPGDALLVSELIADADVDLAAHTGEIVLEHVTSLRAAFPRLPEVDCVLLDMNLPDARGLDAVRELLGREGSPAVVVLTGDTQAGRGRAAVAAGAQDYLIKGRIDGQLLSRSLQYAVDRHHAAVIAAQLQQSRFAQAQNRRLARGLLPTALLHDPVLTLETRYQPGDREMLLGGDFYDVVQTDDGTVHVLIGDVSGHGADEAALGVSLRIAWRTLILAGMPSGHTLPVLNALLRTERHEPGIFATAATVVIAPERDRMTVFLAGHPPPLLLDEHGIRRAPDDQLGPPLGVLPSGTWDGTTMSAPVGWGLLAYTDGLIEATDDAGEPLWIDGLETVLHELGRGERGRWPAPSELLGDVLRRVAERAPHRRDDLAVVLLTCADPPGSPQSLTARHLPAA